MKKRALMFASVASMIQQFNMDNIRLLLDGGWEVDVACNMEQGSTITSEKIAVMKHELEEMGVRVIHIPVPRRISAVRDIVNSFRMTQGLIAQGEYSLIHCHSPIGGILCRLANRVSGCYGRAKLIYTAHGFHFFKGAPVMNWLIFYPLEWFCSRYTDVLITINREDYALAQAKLKAKQTTYVPGIGVDVEKFCTAATEVQTVKEELGLDGTQTVLLSVGELSARKNHEVVLRALARLELGNYRYFICGIGPLETQLKNLIRELKLEDRVHLLGYRSDIPRIMNLADIYVFPSLQEGLPVALMESMAAGKAAACSKIRGNTDLVEEKGGVLFDPYSVDDCAAAIRKLLDSDYGQMGCFNARKIQHFSRKNVGEMMAGIYGCGL